MNDVLGAAIALTLLASAGTDDAGPNGAAPDLEGAELVTTVTESALEGGRLWLVDGGLAD
ncbi:MAG: hypothetical protein ACRD29_08665 [Acidimicrobiales bacterium]